MKDTFAYLFLRNYLQKLYILYIVSDMKKGYDKETKNGRTCMNAIILAAGVGHRMINLTKQTNKTLLPIGGVPMIERTIQYLKQAGIEDITVVTGHKKELFMPLKEKYAVQLIYNKKYSVYNSLYSLKLVLNKLEDTFVIHGDVVLFKNFFMRQMNASTLYTIFKNPKGVPMMKIHKDEQYRLKQVEMCSVNERITTFLGICYFTKEDSEMIKKYYETSITEKKLRDYKGELETELLPLLSDRMVVHHVDNRYAMEINVMDDYYQACIKYENFWKP